MSEPRVPKWSNAPFTPEELERIANMVAARHNLRLEDARKLVARTRATKRNPLLEEQWVAVTHRMCEAIRRGEAKPAGIFEAVFWIRLYGCMTDLQERFARWKDAHVGVDSSWPPYRFLAACAEVAAACGALRECLSDDETVYVAFVRHLHAHVYQEGFELAIEPGNAATGQRGAVRTKQKVRPLGRHIDIEEAHAIVDRIHLEHGNDERRIASTFAGKVSEPLRRLQRAMEELKLSREIPDEGSDDHSK